MPNQSLTKSIYKAKKNAVNLTNRKEGKEGKQKAKDSGHQTIRKKEKSN